eukprot:211604-Rhodomonas_salina.3
MAMRAGAERSAPGASPANQSHSTCPESNQSRPEDGMTSTETCSPAASCEQRAKAMALGATSAVQREQREAHGHNAHVEDEGEEELQVKGARVGPPPPAPARHQPTIRGSRQWTRRREGVEQTRERQSQRRNQRPRILHGAHRCGQRVFRRVRSAEGQGIGEHTEVEIRKDLMPLHPAAVQTCLQSVVRIPARQPAIVLSIDLQLAHDRLDMTLRLCAAGEWPGKRP